MNLNENHINYLANLHAGQWFGFNGEPTHENLWVKGHEKPTMEEIEKGLNDAEIKDIENKRKNAYQNESDPLFLKWQRGEATEQDWLDKIAEIKERFPKSE